MAGQRKPPQTPLRGCECTSPLGPPFQLPPMPCPLPLRPQFLWCASQKFKFLGNALRASGSTGGAQKCGYGGPENLTLRNPVPSHRVCNPCMPRPRHPSPGPGASCASTGSNPVSAPEAAPSGGPSPLAQLRAAPAHLLGPAESLDECRCLPSPNAAAQASVSFPVKSAETIPTW